MNLKMVKVPPPLENQPPPYGGNEPIGHVKCCRRTGVLSGDERCGENEGGCRLPENGCGGHPATGMRAEPGGSIGDTDIGEYGVSGDVDDDRAAPAAPQPGT